MAEAVAGMAGAEARMAGAEARMAGAEAGKHGAKIWSQFDDNDSSSKNTSEYMEEVINDVIVPS